MTTVFRVTLIFAGLLLSSTYSLAVEPCDWIQDAASDRLVSFLTENVPTQNNADCIVAAIRRLGDQRYEPAVGLLVKLLDFRRPPTAREKHGLYLHIQTVDELYPAARALEEIGEKAMPAVLDAIKGQSTSTIGRENALYVWMEVHKSDSPEAISIIRKEHKDTYDLSVKRNLEWALSRAPNLCNPSEKELCEAAAREEQ